ncbi:hypothetical protein [Breznakiella homolactica]|uniref:Uncharacterized protein n=1 Tax=Breznakiella homolactica TaxID=2798577 RepID=A0A7T8BAI4_9SPIR|nr:hypothetical protein [Breznakiella homolactica]QQO10714.1 hypothetical protein JFL75_07315 [Breznakiella homolactica]
MKSKKNRLFPDLPCGIRYWYGPIRNSVNPLMRSIVIVVVNIVGDQISQLSDGNDIEGEIRITWVQGGYNYHNYGLAIDLEFYTDIDNSWAKDWTMKGLTGRQ